MATRYTLKMLIHEAYGIEDYKILGGPAWAGSDLFNLEAKPASWRCSTTARPLNGSPLDEARREAFGD